MPNDATPPTRPFPARLAALRLAAPNPPPAGLAASVGERGRTWGAPR